MTIFGQYKEKLTGIRGREGWVKFRRNYEDLERFCVNKKYLISKKIIKIQTENGFVNLLQFFLLSLFVFLQMNLKSE